MTAVSTLDNGSSTPPKGRMVSIRCWKRETQWKAGATVSPPLLRVNLFLGLVQGYNLGIWII